MLSEAKHLRQHAWVPAALGKMLRFAKHDSPGQSFTGSWLLAPSIIDFGRRIQDFGLLPGPCGNIWCIAADEAFGDGAADVALHLASGEVAQIQGSVMLVVREALGIGDEPLNPFGCGRT